MHSKVMLLHMILMIGCLRVVMTKITVDTLMLALTFKTMGLELF